MDERHIVVYQGARSRAVAMDSLTHSNDDFGPSDVVIGASFLGVLTAHWAARYAPRAIIAHDCGIGLEGAGISGLWYLDAKRIPAATVAADSARVGDGQSLFETGYLSRMNYWAEVIGCSQGMSVRTATELLADWDGVLPDDAEIRERRETVFRGESGKIVVMGSIRFAEDSDRKTNVLCVGSHGGVTAGHYALEAQPKGFLSSDGGIGRDRAGVAGLAMLEGAGIPGACVSADSARIGDGMSIYADGIVSVTNDAAASLGIKPGMRARDAARAMLADT